MRLGLRLQVAGAEDNHTAPIKRLITVPMYINFVNKLPVSDQIKDKFKALVAKMPSPALRTVVSNVQEYVRRFEAEVRRELHGICKPVPRPPKKGSEPEQEDAVRDEATPKKKVVASWDDDEFTIRTSNEVTNGSSEIEEGTDEEAGGEEVHEIKWVNACESSDQGGPTPDGEREGDRLHTDLPDGVLSVGGFAGELLAGCEPAAEGGDPVAGEHDDRLRGDDHGAAGVQGGGNAG